MTLEAPPRLDARRALFSVLVAVVVGFILVLSIGRLTGFAELGDTLSGARWQWLGLCAAGQLAVFAGYAGVFRSAVAFERGPVVARRRALEVVLASFGLTQVVASGGAAGLAFTYWALRRIGFERAEAVVRLIGMNTAVYLVFGAVGWVGSAASLVSDGDSAPMALPWLIGVPLVLLAARWFTAPARIDRWTVDRGSAPRRALAAGVRSAAWARRVTTDPMGHKLLAWASLYWAGDIVSLWAGLKAFGMSTDVALLCLAYVTGYLAQLIPVPFLATGGVDAATTLTLSAVGVPIEVALLGVVAHRVFAFWIPIVPGLALAATMARRGGLEPAGG